MKNIILLLSINLLFSQQILAACTYSNPIEVEDIQVGNLLQWTTATELHNQMFVIEKSQDGVNFERIGNLDGAGISQQEKTYRFLDVNAQQGMNLYRFKQIDADGTFEYSRIVSSEKKIVNNFMVVAMAKIPINTKFDITLDVVKDMKVDYTIATLKGEVLRKGNVACTFGLNNVQLDFSNLPDGGYRIQFKGIDEELETLHIKKKETPQANPKTATASTHKK